MTKKLSPKEINEPDFLHSAYLFIMDYFSKNKTIFYAVAGGVAFVFVLSVGLYFYFTNYERTAHQLYVNIQTAVKNNPPKQDIDVIKDYKNIISNYPRSQAAVTSYYHLGNLYYKLNDMKSAIIYYKKFTDRSPSSSGLSILCYMSLGYCYEATGDLNKSLESFEMIPKLQAGSYIEGSNDKNIARIYELMDKRDKALEYYQKALNKAQDSSSKLLIQRKISSLL
jgi:tetratricopeptide (TPR) repeat protein